MENTYERASREILLDAHLDIDIYLKHELDSGRYASKKPVLDDVVEVSFGSQRDILEGNFPDGFDISKLYYKLQEVSKEMYEDLKQWVVCLSDEWLRKVGPRIN